MTLAKKISSGRSLSATSTRCFIGARSGDVTSPPAADSPETKARTRPPSMRIDAPRTRPTRLSAIAWAILLDHIEHAESSGKERDARVGCAASSRFYCERKLERLGFLVSVAKSRSPNRYRAADGVAMPECPCCRRRMTPVGSDR